MNVALTQHIVPQSKSNIKLYALSVGLIIAVSVGCYFIAPLIGYRSVALILLLTVLVIAMVGEMKPVIISAVLSASIWDFFFIPPKFTLLVDNTEDALILIMYLVLAILSAVFTIRLRKKERLATEKKGKETAIGLYSTLLNSISHELRTPLTIIIAATDNLKDNSKLSPEHKDQLVEEILQASLRLNGQVENLLNMSRLESGVIQVKRDWYDMSDLVYTVVNRLKENAPKRMINVRIQEDIPLVKIDIGLIEQALHNLLQNAIQYVPKHCIITVTAFYKNGTLTLVLEDNGEGFPAENKERVSEKLYRLRSSVTGGTGLGLSIVKGFVEAHEGTVRLENVGEGADRFIIEIPAEAFVSP